MCITKTERENRGTYFGEVNTCYIGKRTIYLFMFKNISTIVKFLLIFID